MANKTFTTSIVYINSEPHIGFLLELVATDVLARFAKLQKNDVFFVTGTDEHGIKIEKAATASGKEPQVYADEIAQKYIDLCKDFNISNDYFVRTTDEKHKKFVQQSWQQLEEKGVLEKREYQGLYCVGCEAFKAERELENGKCAIHQSEVEKISEQNYFFKLTDTTKEQIITWLNTNKIKPETKTSEVLNMLKDFEGVSVSRPKTKLSWGIAVPNDDSQVMYVWVDALLNYLSAITSSGKSIEDFWSESEVTQVIGKDILKFHAIIWPALLIELGYPLPDKLVVHGFINVDGQKMSKSLGNVITPTELKEKYGVDATRYLLLRQLNFYDDSNFVWEEFDAIYNGELANGLGNLLARTIGLKNKSQSILEDAISQEIANYSQTFNEQIKNSPLNELDFAAHLAQVNLLIKDADEWINTNEAWKGIKDDERVLPITNLFKICALLEPVIPKTALKIYEQLKDLEAVPLFPRL